MPQLNSYLFFNGTCAEAMHFYEATLGARLESMMTLAQTPMANHSQPDMADRIVHAHMLINGQVLMASDWLAEQPYPGMHGFSLWLGYLTIAESQRIFDALADGGAITMPFQKTFWTEGFGMLSNRYGTPWMVAVAPQ